MMTMQLTSGQLGKVLFANVRLVKCRQIKTIIFASIWLLQRAKYQTELYYYYSMECSCVSLLLRQQTCLFSLVDLNGQQEGRRQNSAKRTRPEQDFFKLIMTFDLLETL